MRNQRDKNISMPPSACISTNMDNVISGYVKAAMKKIEIALNSGRTDEIENIVSDLAMNAARCGMTSGMLQALSGK